MTQEFDTTTERKLWLSGAWGRSQPTSICILYNRIIACEEKKARLFLANLGIDYDALTMEQFTNLIEVLKLSKHMNSPISQRGKGSMTHGKGKRKRK